MKIFFAFLFLFSASVAFGQKATNKLTFAKGQTLEVLTNIDISAESMMGPTSGTVTIADTYTVSDASPESYTLQKVPKQVKMNFTVGSQQMKVDSDKPEEMNSLLAQPVKEIMSRKPEFTVDASGKITSVKMIEAEKKEGTSGNMMGLMLPGMDMASAQPQAGNPSIFQVLPEHEVGIGDTWTDSLSTEDNKNRTTYKVKNITDSEIILDFTSEGTTTTTKEAMGMKVAVDAANKATGTILLDKTTGIIKQKASTNTTETRMNMGGQEMSTTVKTTAVTGVRTL